MSEGAGKVEIEIGFDFTWLSKTQIGLKPSSWLSSTVSSTTIRRLRSGSGSALWVPPPKGGAQTLWVMSFGLALSLTSTTARQASRHEQ